MLLKNKHTHKSVVIIIVKATIKNLKNSHGSFQNSTQYCTNTFSHVIKLTKKVSATINILININTHNVIIPIFLIFSISLL